MKIIIFIILMTTISCSKKIKVDTVTAINSYVESTVSTISSGTVEAKKQSELAFGSIGRIAIVRATLGSVVSEGTIIAEMENSDLKAVHEEALKELDRANELFKNGLVSISNLDSAKRAKEVTRLNLEKTIIKAPFKGMITALDLKVGEFYQTSTTATLKPKVQIIDLEKRLVKGEIDEIDLNRVRTGQYSRIKIPALKSIIFQAKVQKVVPFVSTAKDQDRTSQIELELIVDKGQDIALIPVGASADVEIITEKKENVLVIPSNYIQGVGNNKFVYKVNSDKLIKTNIKTGSGNYDRTEIIDGLKLNDQIARPPEGIEDVTSIKIEAEVKKWP